MTQACCKVGRVIDKYGLAAIDDELRERRAGGSDPDSLRTLQRYFNQRVLRAAMEAAEMDPLDGEVENAYRLLTNDDVSSGMRTRTRQRLKRNGIDVDGVERDFISHPTIGNHLSDCLDVEPATADEGTVADRENVENRIFKMQSRTEAVTAGALEQLQTAGLIEGGDLTVLVDLQVLCEDCGAQHTVREFLQRDGCECG